MGFAGAIADNRGRFALAHGALEPINARITSGETTFSEICTAASLICSVPLFSAATTRPNRSCRAKRN
jgi:hypothetical protein